MRRKQTYFMADYIAVKTSMVAGIFYHGYKSRANDRYLPGYLKRITSRVGVSGPGSSSKISIPFTTQTISQL